MKSKTVTVRGQSKPPKYLARFIELVNAERLFEQELPDPYKDFLERFADPRTARGSPRDVWIEHHLKAAATLSAATRRFLGPPSNVMEFSKRYGLLRSAGEVLSGIARRSWSVPSYAASSDVMIRVAEIPDEFPYAVQVGLVVNPDGVLTISGDDLLKSLVGVPADRIRSCAICQRIFWAPRINSECCSERCRKTYNQRSSRQARKAQISARKLELRKGKER